MVEAERRVYADRSKYLGDPDFYKVPVDSLLNTQYITSRMQTLTGMPPRQAPAYNPARLLVMKATKPPITLL
jgi:gamma-glutamyltranspeptidase/glutathione hydrolase